MLLKARLLTLALLLACAGPVAAQTQGVLDIIPAEASAAIAVRNLDDLKTKGDELVIELNKRIDHDKGPPPLPRLSELFAEVHRGLGITDGVDYQGSAALILVPKEQARGPARNRWFPDNRLILVLPFKDRDKLAANFGFKPGQLKPGRLMKRKQVQEAFPAYFYARGNHLFLGEDPKAVEYAAKAKPLRQAMPAKQAKVLEQADALGHFNLRAIAKELDFDPKRNADKTSVEKIFGDYWMKGLEPRDKQVARQLVKAIDEVRFLDLALRVDKGLALSFLAVFPEKGAKEAHQLLADLGAGPKSPGLVGLPEGSVVAAVAAGGDNRRTAIAARVLFPMLLRGTIGSRPLVSTATRPLYVAAMTEVWRRVRTSRAALYQTKDESKHGLFSLVGILESDDADRFLADMHLWVRIAEEPVADKGPVKQVDIAKLVEELGSPRYRVRESAMLKLRLLGEPALPHLAKGKEAKDLELSRRAERLWTEISAAAAERRKELLTKEFPRHLHPTVTFAAKPETRTGQRVEILRLKLAEGEATAAKNLRNLLGPQWQRIRLAACGKQLVVFLGSEVELLDETLANLKAGKPGLAAAKSPAGFARQPGSARNIEFHVSGQRLAALMAEPEEAAKLLPRPAAPLTSFGLAIGADDVQLDILLPLDELALALRQGWFR
jgi:hypothetical protein